MVDTYLEHLRRQRALVRPLAGGPLRRWKETLGAFLPAALARLYEVTDGTSGHEELPMRLMGHAEVLEMTDALSDDLTRARTDRLFTFWTSFR